MKITRIALMALSTASLFLMNLPTAGATSVPAYTLTGFGTTSNGQYTSLGYTFTTTQPLAVSAMGVLDIGGTTIQAVQNLNGDLAAGFPVKLYNVSGQTFVTGLSATVDHNDPILSLSGGTYTTGDGFRYHTLSSPVTLPAGSYEIVMSQVGTAGGVTFKYNGTGIAQAAGIGAYGSTYYNLSGAYVAYATNLSVVTNAVMANLLVSPVPEPASISLLIFGGIGLLAYRRNQLRKPQSSY